MDEVGDELIKNDTETAVPLDSVMVQSAYRRLDSLMDFDHYNARVVSKTVSDLEESPEWRAIKSRLDELSRAKFEGRTLREQIDYKLRQKIEGETERNPFRKISFFSHAFDQMTIRSELLNGLAEQYQEDDKSVDAEVVRFTQLHNGFRMKMAFELS